MVDYDISKILEELSNMKKENNINLQLFESFCCTVGKSEVNAVARQFEKPFDTKGVSIYNGADDSKQMKLVKGVPTKEKFEKAFDLVLNDENHRAKINECLTAFKMNGVKTGKELFAAIQKLYDKKKKELNVQTVTMLFKNPTWLGNVKDESIKPTFEPFRKATYNDAIGNILFQIVDMYGDLLETKIKIDCFLNEMKELIKKHKKQEGYEISKEFNDSIKWYLNNTCEANNQMILDILNQNKEYLDSPKKISKYSDYANLTAEKYFKSLTSKIVKNSEHSLDRIENKDFPKADEEEVLDIYRVLVEKLNKLSEEDDLYLDLRTITELKYAHVYANYAYEDENKEKETKKGESKK